MEVNNENFQWYSVSIPSSGSIQFLLAMKEEDNSIPVLSLNPLKRVNSILTHFNSVVYDISGLHRSQSPQAGQFNSYGRRKNRKKWPYKSQSPQAGQFNSYISGITGKKMMSGNVSIPSSGSIQFLLTWVDRVEKNSGKVSIPSSGSIQFLLVLCEV